MFDETRPPWIVFGISALLLVLLPLALIRHWRGRSAAGDDNISRVFYRSKSLRDGHVRAIPVVLLWGVSLVFGIILIPVAPRYPEGEVNPFYSWGILVFGGLTLLAVLLYWLIVLTGRPENLVAPHLRKADISLNLPHRNEYPGMTAPELPARAEGTGTHKLLSVSVVPEGSLVSVGDTETDDIPIWADSDELVASSPSMILVGTRSPQSGPVHIEVVANGEPYAEARLAFVGDLELRSGVLAVGNSLSGQVEEIRANALSAREGIPIAHLRIFVVPPEAPSTVQIFFGKSG